MMGEITIAPLLLLTEPEERAGMEGELMALLGERAARYTMGDSSSVPVETAEELLRSIAYCISLHLRLHPGDKGMGAKPLYAAGVKDVERLIRRGRALLHQAQAGRSPVSSIAYEDTLGQLPLFFKRYDYSFFAHAIPCDIDYPLCHPLPDGLLGIEYVNEYLRRFCLENDFLGRIPPRALRGLLERLHPDYAELILNLYAPAAEAAVWEALGDAARLRDMPEAQATQALRAAARQAGASLSLQGEWTFSYLERTAVDMLPRLLATEPYGRVHV